MAAETIHNVLIAGSSTFNYHIGGLFEKMLHPKAVIGSVKPSNLFASLQKDKFDIVVTEENGRPAHSLIQQVRLISSGIRIILFTPTGTADCDADLILPVEISAPVRSRLKEFLQNLHDRNYKNSSAVENPRTDLLIHLTTRQLEVFEGIWKNLSNAQMAEKLFISERTVEDHRKDLYRLTGSKTIQDIMKFGFTQKWCDEKAHLNEKFYAYLKGIEKCYVQAYVD